MTMVKLLHEGVARFEGPIVVARCYEVGLAADPRLVQVIAIDGDKVRYRTAMGFEVTCDEERFREFAMREAGL